jgi:hypothetical protein
MPSPNRFHREATLLCTGQGCKSADFRYAIEGPDSPTFRLRLRTSGGPITVDAGNEIYPDLASPVKCSACGRVYTPLSRWDPA